MRKSGIPKGQSPREVWKEQWGKGYDIGPKNLRILPLMEELDKQGRLGRNIIDIGSGSTRMIGIYDGSVGGVYYPTEGKKIVRIDIAMPYPSRSIDSILEIRGDLEGIEDKSIAQLRRFVRVARHFGADPRQDIQIADTILLSEVLNYIDYKKTIGNIPRFLKRQGRLVIYNDPTRGFREVFSPAGLKANSELIAKLEEVGLGIEHLTCPRRHYGKEFSYPRIEGFGENDLVLLVAKKSG